MFESDWFGSRLKNIADGILSGGETIKAVVRIWRQ